MSQYEKLLRDINDKIDFDPKEVEKIKQENEKLDKEINSIINEYEKEREEYIN